jgi:AraC-like DNA-binding protein
MSEPIVLPKLDDIHLGRVIYRMRPKGYTWPKSFHRRLWELTTVWAGGTRIDFEDHLLDLGVGQAVLISPTTTHSTIVTHDKGCLYLNIHFELDWPALLPLANRGLELSPRVQAHLRDMLDVQDVGVVADTRRRAILALILLEMVHPSSQQIIPHQLLSRTDNELVRSVLTTLREDLREGIRMDHLCAVTGYSASRLRTLFRRHMGMSLTEAMFILRLDEAQRLLRHSGFKIGVIAQMTGFKQASKFTRFFRARMGITPREYASSHAPLGIAWRSMEDDLNMDDVRVDE